MGFHDSQHGLCWGGSGPQWNPLIAAFLPLVCWDPEKAKLPEWPIHLARTNAGDTESHMLLISLHYGDVMPLKLTDLCHLCACHPYSLTIEVKTEKQVQAYVGLGPWQWLAPLSNYFIHSFFSLFPLSSPSCSLLCVYVTLEELQNKTKKF